VFDEWIWATRRNSKIEHALSIVAPNGIYASCGIRWSSFHNFYRVLHPTPANQCKKCVRMLTLNLLAS
jgi:hypothetical protein